MSDDLFDEEDSIETERFGNADEDIDSNTYEDSTLDARRRLENMLEEKRLRDELEDFLNY